MFGTVWGTIWDLIREIVDCAAHGMPLVAAYRPEAQSDRHQRHHMGSHRAGTTLDGVPFAPRRRPAG